MPGQTVNTLEIPVEQALRQRSASLTSMRITDFKTMDPESKYVTPRPPPSIPSENPPLRRLGSSPLLNHKSSTRSLSPAPAPAWKRFFGRKLPSREGERGRSPIRQKQSMPDFRSAGPVYSRPFADDADVRSLSNSEGTRSRDISPESLRRFLIDDTPSRPGSNLSVRPTLVIPEDILEDNDNDNDDDDNFATSAASDAQPYMTRLSPPPFKRSASAETIAPPCRQGNSLTVPSQRPIREVQEAPASAVLPSRPRLESLGACQQAYSHTIGLASPVSPLYADGETPNFFDLTDDEDDVISSNNSDYLSFQPSASMPLRKESFECYSLPEAEEEGRKSGGSEPEYAQIGSPALLARGDADVTVGTANFLGPLDTGLGEFNDDLSWVVDAISRRH